MPAASQRLCYHEPAVQQSSGGTDVSRKHATSTQPQRTAGRCSPGEEFTIIEEDAKSDDCPGKESKAAEVCRREKEICVWI
jgi:hypothetical protein